VKQIRCAIIFIQLKILKLTSFLFFCVTAIAQKQPSLHEKVVLLDQQLQDLQEQSSKMEKMINSLPYLYNGMVRLSPNLRKAFSS
jgi:hypothetical protein